MSRPPMTSRVTGSSWATVPAYNTTFQSGINVTVFDRLEPICGPNVFLRVKNTQN